MGKRQRQRISGELKQALRDAELLGLPAGLSLSVDRLRSAVSLLLVCRCALERQIVSLHTIVGISLEEAAARLNQPAGKLRDLHHSLVKSVAAADLAAKQRAALSRWSKGSRARQRIKCGCGFMNHIEAGDPLICGECAQPLRE